MPRNNAPTARNGRAITSPTTSTVLLSTPPDSLRVSVVSVLVSTTVLDGPSRVSELTVRVCVAHPPSAPERITMAKYPVIFLMVLSSIYGNHLIPVAAKAIPLSPRESHLINLLDQ